MVLENFSWGLGGPGKVLGFGILDYTNAAAAANTTTAIATVTTLCLKKLCKIIRAVLDFTISSLAIVTSGGI